MSPLAATEVTALSTIIFIAGICISGIDMPAISMTMPMFVVSSMRLF